MVTRFTTLHHVKFGNKMNTKPPQFELAYYLLTLATRLNPDQDSKAKLREAMTDFQDWDNLITMAENYSVAPLLFTNLRESGVTIPVDEKMKLFGLLQRHKYANLARAEALNEIVRACNEKSILVIVLKGSYLAHSIYPDPSLRTMSDIDLLVPPDRELEVMATLRELGYTVPQTSGSRYMSEHHHLPGAHINRDGQQILVEVHHDALSGDATSSITTGNLTSPLEEFYINGQKHHALGHIDQLRHLYHHMSEPAMRLKLNWCADIVYYADSNADEIDWEMLERNYPNIINALRLVNYIVSLPENLRQYITIDNSPMPSGTGISILPLTSLLNEPLPKRIKGLLYPSNWWMRLYYGIPPGNSLLLTRWINHPIQVYKWVYRRMNASRNHTANAQY
jgi:hypothetical protein